MAKPLGTKLYYSIGEVADLTELAPYTLRAWETEFSCLRPKRVRGKNRAYRRRDIAIILLIRRLLHEERYSTRGAQQKLRNEPQLIQGAVEHLEGLDEVSPAGFQRAGGPPLKSPPATEGDGPTAPALEAAEAAAGPQTRRPEAPPSTPGMDSEADASRQLLRHVHAELQEIVQLLRRAP